MLTLTQRLAADATAIAQFTLALTAEERMRSRHHFHHAGQPVYLSLPRGTVLHHDDLLLTADGAVRVRVVAKAEPVMTVRGAMPLALLRAAYHLGNRHVPLEVTECYLRLSPDPVLKTMLEHMGLEVIEEEQPFHPELGAYGHAHAHAH